jgi:hypothetical protein
VAGSPATPNPTPSTGFLVVGDIGSNISGDDWRKQAITLIAPNSAIASGMVWHLPDLQFVGLQKNDGIPYSAKSPREPCQFAVLAISVRFITSKTKGLSSGNVLAD